MRKLPTSTAIQATPASLIHLQRHVLSSCRPRGSPSHLLARRPFFSTPPPSLAQLRNDPLTDVWFTSSQQHLYASGPPPPPPLQHEQPSPSSPSSHDPNSQSPPEKPRPPPKKTSDHPVPSARTLALGKTLRQLSPLLPTLLLHPLPPHLLSPHITLHLFPSTHPHLPVVKGRVGYRAALWTAPVAWGRVPIVGDVRLEILSERVVRTAPTIDEGASDEKLVVRWQTESSSSATSSSPSSAAATPINRGLSTLLGGGQPLFRLLSSEEDKPGQFSGLFIFTFDEEGRILSHTIEHVEEGSGWDKTARVVSLTDWLLGKARGKSKEDVELGLGLACRWEGVARAEMVMGGERFGE